MAPKLTTKVKLTRSIILNGEVEDEGTEHELETGLAHRLIGEGSAALAEGEEENRPTSVNRMQPAGSADPNTSTGAGKPAPVKKP